ncbi:sensor domain-containing diguanylate cyclase [Sulfuricurvum sp.]|uniref:sensor domain-containing protein n=1 Tax=Sulfuricurvum sp. TaxID=2025608 RepID=UPI00260D9C24|nr:sensor domain-containing diguanylate cyclase [Sulfuricurvum sp.]MDD2266867.1 sensor domain-containing diguanylate cyclase [Sulfuricurvum sp.]MDD2784476.1 sensor domain-containing diguanylate cyclase [Sulfuricurvum sp.]
MGKDKQTLQNDPIHTFTIQSTTNPNLLQAILESSPNVIIFALDTAYEYLAFNHEHKKAMQAIWGKEIEPGLNMLEIISRKDDYQKAKTLFDRALGGEFFVDESEYGDEVLSRKFWQTYYSPIYDDTEQKIIGLTCFNLDISERRNIENQFQLADLALNMITDAVYLFNDKREIIYVNHAACDSLGYSKEELIGKTPFDIDPVITVEALQNIRETIRLKKVKHFESKHKRKDGSVFDVEITTYPYNEGQYGLHIVTNITERKKTEEKLKLLASVFTSAKEGIVITDTKGVIVEANEAYSLITGYSNDEVVGQNAGFLKSDKHDKAFYKNMWNELIRNKYWIGEIWNRRKSGEIFVERLTISAISDSEGKILSYVGLLTDITTGKDYESTLERMAFYDSLTGLPNRLLFAERINQAMMISKRLHSILAVCYLDLDEFKPVNDSFGHNVGDKLLLEISNRMKNHVRESDTIARIGGDEFAILLVNIKSIEECETIITKILDSINEPYILPNNEEVNVTASIGITLYPHDNVPSDILLRHADQAMYLAKESGKNQYIFHN